MFTWNCLTQYRRLTAQISSWTLITALGVALGGVMLSLPASAEISDTSENSIQELNGREKRLSEDYDRLCDDLRGTLAKNFRDTVFRPLARKIKTSTPSATQLQETIQWRGHDYKIALSQTPGSDSIAMTTSAVTQKARQLGKQEPAQEEKSTQLRDMIEEQLSERCQLHNDAPDSIYAMTEEPNTNTEVLDEIRLAKDLMGLQNTAADTLHTANAGNRMISNKRHKDIVIERPTEDSTPAASAAPVESESSNSGNSSGAAAPTTTGNSLQ
ncbi:MAG: hypothetical protein P4M08_07765 [Oligoflexia bacterium]|nr:hypothetical protein [Oligoflexia bacterium]